MFILKSMYFDIDRKRLLLCRDFPLELIIAFIKLFVYLLNRRREYRVFCRIFNLCKKFSIIRAANKIVECFLSGSPSVVLMQLFSNVSIFLISPWCP